MTRTITTGHFTSLETDPAVNQPARHLAEWVSGADEILLLRHPKTDYHPYADAARRACVAGPEVLPC